MASTKYLLIYVVAGLMLSVGSIYFYEAYVESQEFSTEFTAQIETTLFTTAGILYFPFGIWMLKSKYSSKAPYLISLIGSVALVGLYIASRSISLPIVGLQEDVGFTDMASKVLQVGVIAICSIVLVKTTPQIDKIKR